MAEGEAVAGTAVRLIPDLHDELSEVLWQVEEVLITLAVWESDTGEPTTLPTPLARREALEALDRLEAVIEPTQSRHNQPAGSGRLLGPDGHYQHRPLRLATIDRADLATLTAAAQLLGQALATAPHSELTEALTLGATITAPLHGPAPEPVALVEGLARALGVLDLETTPDTARLTTILTSAGHADVVLSAPDEAAYQRLAQRFNDMWTSGNDIHRSRY